MTTKKRTDLAVQTVLMKNKDELFNYCIDKSQFRQLQEKVSEILDSDELKDNTSVGEVRVIFNNCRANYNRYLSTLMTYLIGMKVS